MDIFDIFVDSVNHPTDSVTRVRGKFKEIRERSLASSFDRQARPIAFLNRYF